MSARPISSVAIAGGGIVGWSAAAAIRRQLPAVQVTVVPVDPPPDALADRVGCTLPSIVDFHDDLGLKEADTVVRAGSSFRLGTRFTGWASRGEGYVHAYGGYGLPLAPCAFHQHWLRAFADGEAAPFDAFSAGAVLGSGDRFLRPGESAASHAASFGYGLHIDPPRYREMMRAFALHLGAAEAQGEIADVRVREGGFIDAIVLDGAREVRADLFVDATGPRALVRGRIDRQSEDWDRYFAVDSLIIADSPAACEPQLLDHVKALGNGWTWHSASSVRQSRGMAFSSSHLGGSEAQEVNGGGERVAIKPGRLANPWVRNCVAIGDSAVAIEPLEWTNLHLAHSAIDRLVAMMPDTDCNPVELWDYNRQVNAEADRVRDFLLVHYAAADRPDDDFWRDASARPLPASLEHTLGQWRERGRLPFYEEETFARDSWAAVLIGQGVIPRRIDPLLDAVPAAESARAMERFRAGVSAAAANAPGHASYLRNLALLETR